MTQDNEVLVTLLAMTDATWRPMRGADWQARAGGVLWARRREYRDRGGIPWIGGGDATARQASGRMLDALAADGDVLVHRTRGTGGVFVKLTDSAEHRLRALCDLPSIADARALLLRVIELERPGGPDGRLCSELWLAGLKNYVGDYMVKLFEVQRSALPGLCRGWLLAPSDCYGRTFYAATPIGREVASKPPTLPADLPGPDQEAIELYDSATTEYRERLRAMRPEGSDIGPCPLPCSIDLPRPRRRRGARPEVLA